MQVLLYDELFLLENVEIVSLVQIKYRLFVAHDESLKKLIDTFLSTKNLFTDNFFQLEIVRLA